MGDSECRQIQQHWVLQDIKRLEGGETPGYGCSISCGLQEIKTIDWEALAGYPVIQCYVSVKKRYRSDDKSPWGSPERVVRAVVFLALINSSTPSLF